MRILHVVPTYLPAWRYGGLIHSVHGLCKSLVKRGHQVEVFTTNVDGPEDSDVPVEQAVDVDGVSVWYFRSPLLRRIYWSPGLGAALRRRMRDFEIAHLHSLFLWPTLAAARAARRFGVPYVVAPRGMLVQELVSKKSAVTKRAWLTLFERKTIESAAATHFTSDLEAAEARRFGWRLPREVIVPNGVELPAKGNGARRGDYILFLGRINWKKGLDRLIEALSKADNVRLIVAGNDEDGYSEYLERLARETGVSDRLEFTGFVAGEEKWRLYREAVALVAPSISENFGNVVLEAMSVGRPVIVTPGVGLAETVRAVEAGIVSSSDPESLARSILYLVNNPAEADAMGARGRDIVAKQFTWDSVAAQMEHAYADAAE